MRALTEDQKTSLRAKAYRLCGQCRTPEQAIIALRWLDRAGQYDRLIAGHEAFYVGLALGTLSPTERHTVLSRWASVLGKRL